MSSHWNIHSSAFRPIRTQYSPRLPVEVWVTITGSALSSALSSKLQVEVDSRWAEFAVGPSGHLPLRCLCSRLTGSDRGYELSSRRCGDEGTARRDCEDDEASAERAAEPLLCGEISPGIHPAEIVITFIITDMWCDGGGVGEGWRMNLLFAGRKILLAAVESWKESREVIIHRFPRSFDAHTPTYCQLAYQQGFVGYRHSYSKTSGLVAAKYGQRCCGFLELKTWFWQHKHTENAATSQS